MQSAGSKRTKPSGPVPPLSLHCAPRMDTAGARPRLPPAVTSSGAPVCGIAPRVPGRSGEGQWHRRCGSGPGIRAVAFPRPASLRSEIPEQKALELRLRLSRGEIRGLPAPQVRHLLTSRPATESQSPSFPAHPTASSKAPRAPAKAAGDMSKDFIKSSERHHCKPTALAHQRPGTGVRTGSGFRRRSDAREEAHAERLFSALQKAPLLLLLSPHFSVL